MTQIVAIPGKTRKREILKLKSNRTLMPMTKLRGTLISVISSLLMMTRTLRRSSFLYFHVSLV